MIFVAALLFSVMFHETGHFVTAKKFGMKCTRYFVGFGPTLWSITRGETEYGIKALPLGGFVKIIGMTSMEDDVDPADEPRSFRKAPGWQRIIVLAAGSFMHFVLAALIVFGLALGIGIQTPSSSAKPGTIEACLPPTWQAGVNGYTCTAKDPESPAKRAGLRVGDLVTSFDGKHVANWQQFTTAVAAVKPGTTVPMTVRRDGRTVSLHITPTALKGRPQSKASDGRPEGYIGVVASYYYQPTSVLSAVKLVGSSFSQEITGTGRALAQVPAAIPYLFDKNVKRSSTPAGNIGSVVGAAEQAGQAAAQNAGWQYKVSNILLIIAALNIIIGVANLFLPILPLDGGHVALIIWERIRAWIARLRGRPDPGLVDIQKVIPVSLCVFAVLVLFSLTLIAADIINPVNIG
ncbi:MAG: site-2 protease family protein [Nocardiopsaceae bacterium]|nr:site-2 protease family protein [Nocardiopsaceae bacterium]